jgi:hypothetical protein
MNVDKSIVDAIEGVVAEEGESSALSRALLSWIDAINKGESKLENWAETDKRLELILEVLKDGN